MNLRNASSMLECYDLVVIGAGPSGLMAAGTAAQNGAKVLILDKNNSVGKKLSITGKGRCNITNNCTIEEFMDAVISNKRFLHSSINTFSPQDTIDFFENLGLKTKTERGRRVFPVSDKASDVVRCLSNFAFQNGCYFLQTKAKQILLDNNSVYGLKHSDGKIYAKNILIATGGVSYPGTGSTGDGFVLAKSLGHNIIEPSPSLVPLVCYENFCKELQGLSLKNVSLTLSNENGKVLYKELGEMLFTHFGVSGPLVLSASAHMIHENGYTISIDFKPGLNSEKLDARLLREFSENKNKQFQNLLHNLLPRKLIPVILRLSDISADTPCNSINKIQRLNFAKLLKNFTLKVKSFRPLSEAIITRGGVSTKEINPKTMQSKLIKGLFFAGEVIDVDAYTGGYNLQIAFCTGYAAGRNILYD